MINISEIVAKTEAMFDLLNARFFYQSELIHLVITVSSDNGRGAYGWCSIYELWQGKNEYQVVGVIMMPEDAYADDYVPYVGRPNFKTVQQFNDFIATLRANARDQNDESEILFSNALLALSTCYEDERIMVLCVRKD